MHSRAPLMASPKLAESDEWREPIRDGQKSHRRFIWAVQYGCGSSGSSTFKTKARQLARSLADRPGVAEAVRRRQAERVAAKAQSPRII